jgi:prephenate dehydrogenase
MNSGPDKITVVGIAGLGLMGASLGMALRSSARSVDRGIEVRGWNRTPEVVERARSIGAIDVGFPTLEEAAKGCDFFFVATPVSTVAELALQAARCAPQGCIVSDVGSVKARIVSEVETALPDGKHFIGGHPMCGSELTGLDAARHDLYDGATWVLTPTASTDSQALADLSGLISGTGARVLAVQPEEHDRFVALVSHLPHVVAATLLDLVAGRATRDAALKKLAAGGFRDVTRIAAGSPEIWTDILTWNSPAIIEAIDELTSALADVRKWLEQPDAANLSQFLIEARTARNELFVGRDRTEALWEVAVAIEDRPGTLAKVTTLVGQRGINISDVSITHPVESGAGEAGVLRLTIQGRDEALEAGKALREAGFHTSIRPQVDAVPNRSQAES